MRPSATAAAFLPSSVVAVSSISPVAILPTMTAAPITSAGRFSPRGPRGSMMVNAFANRVPIVWRIGYVTQDDILFPLVRYRLHGRRERVWRCLGSQQTTNGIVAMSRDKTQPYSYSLLADCR